MDKELYRIAGLMCEEAYTNRVDLGTTEFLTRLVSYRGFAAQMLAIPGTDEPLDWVENFKLTDIKGIKSPAVKAADEIHAAFKRVKGVPLYLAGHSKGGATAIAYKRKYGADYCIAFEPARSLRYWIDRRMDNTTIFIDPNDPVTKLGPLSFGHPICKTIMLPDDVMGLKVSEHMMDHINKFIEEM